MRPSPLVVPWILFLLLTTCDNHPSVTKVAAPAQAELITEVALERTICFGECPAYKVSLRRDEMATYFGERFVRRQGWYQGVIYKHDFDKLARLVESQGFFNMKDRYPDDRIIVDAPNAIIRVVRDGKEKAVFDNALEGPIELWGLEMAIDAVAEKVRWEKKK